MSICGKYDLYDHLCMEKTYPSDPRNPHSPHTSDIMECFEIFKEKTGGVIYQRVSVEVNLLNQDAVEQMCPEFKVLPHTVLSEDKRYKEGKKEKVYYTYQFHGEEYPTLEDVNEENVYIIRKIRFDNIIELIPYFPYIIASSCQSGDKETIYIAKKSYIEERYERSIQAGTQHTDEFDHMYRKRLADVTKDIILNYFGDYKERTIQEELPLSKDGDRYVVHPSKKVDCNFEAKSLSAGGGTLFPTLEYIDEDTLGLHPLYSDAWKEDKILVEYVYKKGE